MNLVEALSREIARVTTLKGQYEALRNMPGVNVLPVLSMISTAIERAHKAMGDGDIMAMQVALDDLKGFEA